MKIERFTTEDGRLAERHISTNEAGDIVEELYIEDRRPLRLEKRVIKKHKEILAEQTVETIKDGEVVDVQVQSIDANPKMKLVDHIAKAEKTINSNEFVAKKDIGPIVSDAVVAGVSAVLQSNLVAQAVEPQVSSQSVEVGSKRFDFSNYAIYGAIIIAQVAFLAWVWFGN